MDSTTAAITFVVLAVLLSAFEVVVPGLVLLPFGLGAGLAAVTGFLGASPVAQAVVFIIGSFVAFLALRPLSRRLNQQGPSDGIGAQRLIGATGVVLEHIAAGDTGLVRIDREEWRAEARGDQVLVVGMPIEVIDVVGTRVVVRPNHAEPIGDQERVIGEDT